MIGLRQQRGERFPKPVKLILLGTVLDRAGADRADSPVAVVLRTLVLIVAALVGIDTFRALAQGKFPGTSVLGDALQRVG